MCIFYDRINFEVNTLSVKFCVFHRFYLLLILFFSYISIVIKKYWYFS